MSAFGLMLSDDLVFFSRVAGTARAKGLSVRQVRTAAELLAAAGCQPPTGVLIDLQNPGLDLLPTLTELRAICPTMPPVTGYGSHVEKELMKAAREAGCDEVLPRSKFVHQLEDNLPGWLGEGSIKDR